MADESSHKELIETLCNDCKRDHAEPLASIDRGTTNEPDPISYASAAYVSTATRRTIADAGSAR